MSLRRFSITTKKKTKNFVCDWVWLAAKESALITIGCAPCTSSNIVLQFVAIENFEVEWLIDWIDPKLFMGRDLVLR